MTILALLDITLALLLLGVTTACLTSRHLFRAIILFIAFGLLVAIVWGRLGAIDVALAEAAIGAGLTGALLLAAWRAIDDPAASEERADDR